MAQSDFEQASGLIGNGWQVDPVRQAERDRLAESLIERDGDLGIPLRNEGAARTGAQTPARARTYEEALRIAQSGALLPAPLPAFSQYLADEEAGKFAPPEQKPAEDGNFMRGLKVSVKQIPMLGDGLVGLIGATGEQIAGEGGLWSGVKKWGLDGYLEREKGLQAYSKDTDSLTTSWDRAKQGDFGALVDWAGYGLGYASGQILTSLGVGTIGKFAAQKVAEKALKTTVAMAVSREAEQLAASEAAKGLAREEITKLATRNVAERIGALGAGTALVGHSIGQEGGSIYPGAVAENGGKDLNGDQIAKVWLSTLAAGGIEGLTDKLGLDALTGKIRLGGNLGRGTRAAAGAGIGAAAEGGTEYVQTGIEQYGAGRDLATDAAARERWDAAGLGAIGGGPAGAVAGALHGPAASAPRAPALDEIANSVMSAEDPAEAAMRAAAALDAGDAVRHVEASVALLMGKLPGLTPPADAADAQEQALIAEGEQPVSAPVQDAQALLAQSGLNKIPDTPRTGLREAQALTLPPATPQQTENVAPDGTAISQEVQQRLEQAAAQAPVAPQTRLDQAFATRQTEASNGLQDQGQGQETGQVLTVPESAGAGRAALSDIARARAQSPDLNAALSRPQQYASPNVVIGGKPAVSIDEGKLSRMAKSAGPVGERARMEMARREPLRSPARVVEYLTDRDENGNPIGEAPDVTVTGPTTAEHKMAQQLMRVFGHDVVFYEGQRADGRPLDDGFVAKGNGNDTIYLNARGSIRPLAVAGHELFHQIAKTENVGARALLAIVGKQLKNEDARKAFEAYYFGEGGADARVNLGEEAAADLFGDHWTDASFWGEVFNEIQRRDPSKARWVYEKLVAAVTAAIEKIKAAISGRGYDTAKVLALDPSRVREAAKVALADYERQRRSIARGEAQQRQQAATADGTEGRVSSSTERAEAPEQKPAKTINVDGVERPTTNSKGQPIHPTEEGLRNFWRWFAGSKVVDEDGRPLVAYHGTRHDFREFKREGRAGRNRLHYFASDPLVASEYAGDARYGDPNVVPAYLSIQSPYSFDANGAQWGSLPLDIFPPAISSRFDERNILRGREGTTPRVGFTEVIRAAQAAGYDGVIAENIIDGGGAYGDKTPTTVSVVFSPEQIKSATGNNGDFSPADANITRSTERAEQKPAYTGKAKQFIGLAKPEDTAAGYRFVLRTKLGLGNDDPVMQYLAEVPRGAVQAGDVADRLQDLEGVATEQEAAPVQAREGADRSRARDTINVDGVERPTTNSKGQPIHPTEEGLRNFWRWFAGSKVVDEDGRPLVVYHGSKSAGFNTFDTDGRGKTAGTGAFFTQSPRGASTYSGTTREAVVSDDPEFDPRYEGEAGNYPVYLRIVDPEVIDFEGANWDSYGAQKEWFAKNEDGEVVEYFTNEEDANFFRDTSDEFIEIEESLDTSYTESTDDVVRRAREAGFDGVILQNITDEGPHGDGYGWDDEVWAVFSPEQIKSATGNNGDFSPTDANITRSRARYAWQAQKDNGIGPVYEAPNYTIEPVAKIDTTDEFSHGGRLHMGHAAHVQDANTYAFVIADKNKRRIGLLTAEVNDFGEISAIHDIEINKGVRGSGVGTDVVNRILANSPEPVRVIDVVPSARSFWERMGLKETDQYENGQIEWGASPAALGPEGSDARGGSGEAAQGSGLVLGEEASPEEAERYFGKLASPERAYENIETRPGTTDEQKRVGQQALRDFERRVFGRNPSGVLAEASVLGSAMSADFRDAGGSTLVGQKVLSGKDLAAVAQAVRDPRFETFRVLFVDSNGTVIHESAYSSRLPGAVYLPENFPERVANDKKAANAFGYWVMHNHPSGRAAPSRDDIALTAALADAVPGFHGHVVIDHNEYARIGARGEVRVYDAPELGPADFKANPAAPHEVLGTEVTGPRDVADVAKRLQTKDGYVTLIATDAPGRVSAIVEVPLPALLAARSGGRIKQLRALAQLRRAQRETGSGGNLFAVLPKDAPELSAVRIKGIAQLTDVFTHEGVAASNEGRRPGNPSVVTAADRSGLKIKRAAAELDAAGKDTLFSKRRGTINVDGVDRPTTNSKGQPIHPTEDGLRNFWRWFAGSKVVDEDGRPLVVYHGTTADIEAFDLSRAGEFGERFAEASFFTTNPDVAAGYAQRFDAEHSRLAGIEDELRSAYGKAVVEQFAATKTTSGELTDDIKNQYDEAVFARQERRKALFTNELPTDGANIVPVYLRAETPVEVDASGGFFFNTHKRAFAEAENNAADSVIVRNVVDRANEFADGIGDVLAVFSPEQIKSATGNNGDFSPTDARITKSKRRAEQPLYEDLSRQGKADLERAFGTGLPKTLKERLADLIGPGGQKIVQGLFDQYAPLKNLGQREYMLARLSRASDGTFEALLKYGIPRLQPNGWFNTVTQGGGFLKQMQEAVGPETDRFLQWVAVNRAEELAKLGKERLFSPAMIARLKAELPAGTMADGRDRTTQYRAALKTLDNFNKSVMDVAEQSGLIDGASRQLWESGFYVPFYRNMEDGTTGASIKSGLINQQAFKKLKGSGRQLNEDLLANVLNNWRHLLDASAKNRAAAVILDRAEQLGAARRVPADTRGEKARYVDNGQDVTFKVDDPLLFSAISALEPASTDPFTKYLSTWKHWLTMGVTANPTFKIRNLIRDSISALGQADLSYNPIKNVAEGVKKGRDGSQTYVDMLANGGLVRFGSMAEGNRAKHARRLIEAGVKESTILDTPEKLRAVAQKLWDQYNELGDISENANRVALYSQLIDKGVDPLTAAFEARDLMDFSNTGGARAVRWFSQVVPFLNARLQGLYKLGRAGKDNPKRMGYVTGAVMAASIALWAMQKDDDDWKRREDWDRDNYWWIKVGDTAYRIPKPFEIGALGTLAERTAELMSEDEMTGKRFAQRLRDMFSNTFNMNPIPQAVKPMLDVYANEDSFSRRQIENAGMQRLRPEDRYDTRTSELAKALGKLGLPDPLRMLQGDYKQLSPVQIDFLVKGYLGWIGTSASAVTDHAMRAAGLGDQSEKPDMRLRDYFLVGNFAETLPSSNGSRYLSELYNQAKEIEQLQASYKEAIKRGDLDEATSLRRDNAELLAKADMVENAKKQLAAISQQERQVKESKSLSSETKRKLLDKLSDRKNAIAEATRTSVR